MKNKLLSAIITAISVMVVYFPLYFNWPQIYIPTNCECVLTIFGTYFTWFHTVIQLVLIPYGIYLAILSFFKNSDFEDINFLSGFIVLFFLTLIMSMSSTILFISPTCEEPIHTNFGFIWIWVYLIYYSVGVVFGGTGVYYGIKNKINGKNSNIDA